MVALNFMPKFAAAVEAGAKRQTIRRTARCQPGDALQLYTGQRTGECRKIGEVVCRRVRPVTIAEDCLVLDGWRLPSGDAHQFARADGFVTLDKMRRFFRKQYGLPFDGFVIEWWPVQKLHNDCDGGFCVACADDEVKS